MTKKMSIAEARKAITEGGAYKLPEKEVAAKVEAAGKISNESFPVIQDAAIHAVLFAAQVGRMDYMNKLLEVLHNKDVLAFRGYFVAGVMQTYGQWLSFDKVKGFRIYRPVDEKLREQSATARAKTLQAGEEGLRKISWVNREQAQSDGMAFTADAAFKRIRSTLEKAVKEGAFTVAEAQQWEKGLPKAHKLAWDKIEVPEKATAQATTH